MVEITSSPWFDPAMEREAARDRCARCVAAALGIAIAACSRAPSSSPTGEPPVVGTMTTTATCVALLRQFRAGPVATLTGLPSGCSRASVAEAYGPSVAAVDAVGPAGRYREYTAAAPEPLTMVFFADDRDEARYVRLDAPTWSASDLGPPEATAASETSSIVDQRIWASRGLALHVARTDGAIRRAYWFRPMTIDAYLASDLARISLRREPMR